MKQYRVSVDGGEYRDSTESELPLVVRGCVETFIEAGQDSGVIEFPDCCYKFSVHPEQYFPQSTIDNIHHVCAAIRTMVETLSEIDETQFRQTIAVLRSSASRMTEAAKQERKRNEVLNGDRIDSEYDF